MVQQAGRVEAMQNLINLTTFSVMIVRSDLGVEGAGCIRLRRSLCLRHRTADFVEN
jgi:hypothetical protein